MVVVFCPLIYEWVEAPHQLNCPLFLSISFFLSLSRGRSLLCRIYVLTCAVPMTYNDKGPTSAR